MLLNFKIIGRELNKYFDYQFKGTVGRCFRSSRSRLWFKFNESVSGVWKLLEAIFLLEPEELTEIQFLTSLDYEVCLTHFLNELVRYEIDKMRKLNNLVYPTIYRKDHKKPLLFIFFDTETFEELPPELIEELRVLKDKDDSKVLPARKQIRKKGILIPWVLVWMKEGDTEPQLSFYQDDLHKGFIQELFKLSKEYSLVLTGHNVQYDIDALQPVFEENGLSTASKLKGGDFHLCGFSESETGELTFGYSDTMHFYRMALEKASGIKKDPVPYTLVNARLNREKDLIEYIDRDTLEPATYPLSRYLEYAKNDVLALQAVHNNRKVTIEATQEMAGQEPDFNRWAHLSQAALAEKYVSSYIMKKSGSSVNIYRLLYRPTVSVDEYEAERRSVLGGWSPFDKTHKVYKAPPGQAFFKFDIVSQYPFIMSQGLPASELLSEPPEDCDYRTWYVVEPLIDSRPIYRKEYGHLSAPLVKSSWFSTGGKVFITERLWKVMDLVYFDRDDCFNVLTKRYQAVLTHHAEAYKPLFEIKKKADLIRKNPKSTDKQIIKAEVERQTTKLILNGGYGKLLQKTFPVGKYKIDREIIKESIAVEDCLSSKSGIYVGQCGRAMLAEAIVKLTQRGFFVVRCDTDSIVVQAPKETGLEDIRSILGEETGEIGSWSYEGRFEHHIGFGVAKKYILQPFDDEPQNLKEKYIEKGVALSGIPYLTDLVRWLYLNDRDRYEYLKGLLTSGKNVLFWKAKGTKFRNIKYRQVLIENVNVALVDAKEGGKRLKVGSIIHITGPRSFKVLREEV